MAIYSVTEENITKAAKIIKEGGLIAFPTETVYGLGADLFNPQAVEKIFLVKNRPFFNPLIAHISNINELYKIIENNKIEAKVEKLINKFWPGPLTIVFSKSSKVPKVATGNLSTIAVRMPRNKIALKLIERAGTPLAAPSANLFSQLSPTKAKHVFNQLGEKVDLILDGGDCLVGVESTIVKINKEGVFLLRLGGISVEQLEKELGEKLILGKQKLYTPDSPGQLLYHYAPRTPLEICLEIKKINLEDSETAFLFWQKRKNFEPSERVKFLSDSGSLEEAAKNFYAYLYELDLLNLKKIYVEAFPEIGLGKTLMDRLKKASYQGKNKN